MERLEKLKCETKKLFFQDSAQLWPELFRVGASTDYHLFEAFVERLDDIVGNSAGNSLIRSCSMSDSSSLAALATLAFWPGIMPLMRIRGCPICRHSDGLAKFWKHLNEDHTGSLLVATIGRLECVVQCPEYKVHHRMHQSCVRNDWKDLITLSGIFAGAVRGALKDMPIDHDGLPSCARKFPVYIPEEVTNKAPHPFRGETLPVDCLGRTWLHQYLDSFDPLNDKCPDDEVLARIPHLVARNSADILGRTVLHIACGKGSTESMDQMVEKLLAAGAVSNQRTACGSLPLHYAAAIGSRRICKMLLRTSNCAVNDLDNLGLSALYYAVRHSHLDVVELLLSQEGSLKADPDKHDNAETGPPLIRAMTNDDLRTMRILLEAGADANIEHAGHSAFYNVNPFNAEMIKLLIVYVDMFHLK